ncbi:hypothetical protein TNCV_2434591 [Trichonephila clavipes]|nr:hypothetical protein TNCV_2434591 [Trichonephila clavipes]
MSDRGPNNPSQQRTRCTSVVDLSFEHPPGDSTFWLRSTPILRENTLESLVYADKPQTLDHLEDNIRRVIADIRLQMLEKVIENWTSPDWTTSEPAVAVLCQKSYFKRNATRLSLE